MKITLSTKTCVLPQISTLHKRSCTMAMMTRTQRFFTLVNLRIMLLPLLLFFDMAATSSILLLPFPSYSHVNPMTSIGEILQERGHHVYMFLPSLYPHLANLRATTKIKVMEYPVKAWEWNAALIAGKTDVEMDYFDYITQTSYLSDIKAKGSGYHLICKAVMSSKVIDRNMKHGLNFDLAVVDTHPLSRCHYALMYRHDIPYVSYIQEQDPWLLRSPAVPSYVPDILSERLSDRMGFWERIINLWTVMYWNLICKIQTASEDYVSLYAPEKPYISPTDLARMSRLWLTDTNFLLDYPRPLITNEIPIGWSIMKEAGPLAKDLMAVVEGNAKNGTLAKDGTVVVSLDQNTALPNKLVVTLLKSFRVLNTYNFLWQYTGDISEENVPNNVKVLSYLPINNLLGHRKTKLLITSADNVDQNIALYHGIPTLCLPLDGVQRYNARRTEYHNYGMVIQPQTLTVKLFTQSVRRLLFNDTYQANITLASEIMKLGQSSSRKIVGDWLTLGLANELQILRPFSTDMPWPKYLMLDIAVLILVLLGSFMFLGCSLVHLGLKKAKAKLPGNDMRVIKAVVTSFTPPNAVVNNKMDLTSNYPTKTTASVSPTKSVTTQKSVTLTKNLKQQ